MPILKEYWDDELYFHHTIDRFPEDGKFGMHVHNEYELFYFLSGCAKFLIEDSEYQLTPGTLIIVRPMESHRIKILADGAYERMSVHFCQKLIQDIDPDGALLRPFHDRQLGKDNIYLPEDFTDVTPADMFKNMAGYDIDKRRLNLMIHLLPLLGSIRRAFDRKYSLKAGQSDRSAVHGIIEYINAHLYDNLSLEFLSNRFFISISQLNRIFKSETSSSVWEYILFKRLVAARNLIKNGYPAAEACQKCGFKDYSSFYRSYLKKFGVSPKKDKQLTVSE